jgi:hypothetical protein
MHGSRQRSRAEASDIPFCRSLNSMAMMQGIWQYMHDERVRGQGRINDTEADHSRPRRGRNSIFEAEASEPLPGIRFQRIVYSLWLRAY